MMELFNFYEANIKRSQPIGVVRLGYLIKAIQQPKPHLKHIFSQIEQAEEQGDQATKANLKTQLYSFTPCVMVSERRRYENILNFTGLLVLDFDHLNKDHACELKTHLFQTYPYIYATWLSASRHGVRAIVKIPICKTVDEFKAYYNGITQTMCVYYGFDEAPKNCILPMFYSYDEEILYRTHPDTFNEKIYTITPPLQPKPVYITDKTNSVHNIIRRKIEPITTNGHPQLRAAAYLLGGYVGAGHIDQYDALMFIHNLIDSNAYLSQKAYVYKRTAEEMINKGSMEPVYLNP